MEFKRGKGVGRSVRVIFRTRERHETSQISSLLHLQSSSSSSSPQSPSSPYPNPQHGNLSLSPFPATLRPVGARGQIRGLCRDRSRGERTTTGGHPWVLEQSARRIRSRASLGFEAESRAGPGMVSARTVGETGWLGWAGLG